MMSLSAEYFLDSLQFIQEVNASSLQYYPVESEFILSVLYECQLKMIRLVLILTEERQKRFISASVVHALTRRLLNNEEHDPRILPSVDAYIMSQQGMQGMGGTYAFEELFLSGDKRPSRAANLIVSAFYAFYIPLTIGLPGACAAFQQECRKVT